MTIIAKRSRAILACSVWMGVLIGLLTACDQKEVDSQEENKLNRANPAAVYCVDQGGEYILETGMCELPSGESITAWDLYRNSQNP